MDAQEWNSLPVAGGLRDQPARLFRHMKICLNVYEAHRMHRRWKGGLGKFVKQHPDTYRIITSVQELQETIEKEGR